MALLVDQCGLERSQWSDDRPMHGNCQIRALDSEQCIVAWPN